MRALFYVVKHRKNIIFTEKEQKIVVVSVFFCNFTADFVQWALLVSPAVCKISKKPRHKPRSVATVCGLERSNRGDYNFSEACGRESKCHKRIATRRDARVVEEARMESV